MTQSWDVCEIILACHVLPSNKCLHILTHTHSKCLAAGTVSHGEWQTAKCDATQLVLAATDRDSDGDICLYRIQRTRYSSCSCSCCCWSWYTTSSCRTAWLTITQKRRAKYYWPPARAVLCWPKTSIIACLMLYGLCLPAMRTKQNKNN